MAVLSVLDTARLSESEPSETKQVMGACMMMRKGLRFDERFFLYCEDTELCYRLGQTGKILYVPQAKFFHELGSQQFSKSMAIGRSLQSRQGTVFLNSPRADIHGDVLGPQQTRSSAPIRHMGHRNGGHSRAHYKQGGLVCAGALQSSNGPQRIRLVGSDNIFRGARLLDQAVLEPKASIRHPCNGGHIMRNEQDAATVRSELVNFGVALSLELKVAHRKHLNRPTERGIDMNGDSKAKPRQHAA